MIRVGRNSEEGEAVGVSTLDALPVSKRALSSVFTIYCLLNIIDLL